MFSFPRVQEWMKTLKPRIVLLIFNANKTFYSMPIRVYENFWWLKWFHVFNSVRNLINDILNHDRWFIASRNNVKINKNKRTSIQISHCQFQMISIDVWNHQEQRILRIRMTFSVHLDFIIAVVCNNKNNPFKQWPCGQHAHSLPTKCDHVDFDWNFFLCHLCLVLLHVDIVCLMCFVFQTHSQ